MTNCIKSALFYLFFSLPFAAYCQSASPILWGQIRAIQPDTSNAYGSQYGRLLQLKNGTWLAAYTVSDNAGYQKDPTGGLRLEIAVSHDRCRTWKKTAQLGDPGRDLDNAQMIQLKDGSILLACRSVRWQESYILPVYKSSDLGKTWKRLSVIDQNEGKPGALGKPDKGIYEPHFYFLNDGRLSVMYANEKHVTESPSYSQIISQKISPDQGKTWGEEIWVVHEPGHPDSRPGMPVWTKMKNKKYIVAYEICGPEACNIYYKISEDGINWPQGLGTNIPDQLGAPYILALSNGDLVLTSNKSTVSISHDFGSTWTAAAQAWNKTVWPALYQTGKNEITTVNSQGSKNGRHVVSTRIGKFK